MNVSLESPLTDLDFLILRTINAKPKACTVPARVKIKENSPSLKKMYTARMMPARIPQDTASCFFIYSITCFDYIINIIESIIKLKSNFNSLWVPKINNWRNNFYSNIDSKLEGYQNFVLYFWDFVLQLLSTCCFLLNSNKKIHSGLLKRLHWVWSCCQNILGLITPYNNPKEG